jgi:hypothetical protein
MLRIIVGLCNTVALNCDELAPFIPAETNSHLRDCVVTAPKDAD